MTPALSRVFIGYDPRQPIAAQVLAHSIWYSSDRPVSITRLQLKQLPITRRGLTDFTYSRFLVPWLCSFEGYAIFIDSDFLCRGDISLLMGIVMAGDLTSKQQSHAVWVSKNKLKYEWPSLMVFRNDLCRKLTPEYVEDAKNQLFDFAWASSVGEIPGEWNHLVGYDEPNSNAKMVHFTQGVPCWPETIGCEFSDEWRSVGRSAMSTATWQELMGNSRHAAPVRERLAREAAR